MNKPLWLAGMVSAVAVPYFVIDGNVPSWVNETRQQWATTTDAALNGATTSSAARAHAETPIVPLDEALRLDAQPQSILARWPHVSTVVAESHLAGYRVPLVTGFAEHDVVGSLTWYFNGRSQLQRLSLTGQTRQEQTLVAIAVERFGLMPEPSLDGRLFVARQGRVPLAVLHIQYAPFVSTSAAQPDRTFTLEWNAPATGSALSQEMQARLAQVPR
jgi:hypothetical protein